MTNESGYVATGERFNLRQIASVDRNVWHIVATKVMLAIGSPGTILVPLNPRESSRVIRFVEDNKPTWQLQFRSLQDVLNCEIQFATRILGSRQKLWRESPRSIKCMFDAINIASLP